MRRAPTPELIIGMPPEVEILLSQEIAIGEDSRKVVCNRARVLPVAVRVRWPARRLGEEAEGDGEGRRMAG